MCMLVINSICLEIEVDEHVDSCFWMGGWMALICNNYQDALNYNQNRVTGGVCCLNKSLANYLNTEAGGR